MAEFISNCPHCKANIQLKNEWIGLEVRCPVCSKAFTVTPQGDFSNFDAGKLMNSVPVNNNTISTENDNTQKKATPPPKPRGDAISKRCSMIMIENNEANDYDLAEDIFVLDYLKGVKIVNLILFVFGCVSLVVAAICFFLIDFHRRDFSGVGFAFLFGIIPWYGLYLWNKLILSWLRGVYRNLME